MIGSYQLLQHCPQDECDESLSNDNLKWKQQIFISYRFDMFILVLELVGVGFVRETLIFQTWNLEILYG